MEKVIFRREYNKYTKEWGYLAIFPDDPANPGRYSAVPFKEDGYGKWSFEPVCEIDYNYMLSQKIIHKKDGIIPILVKALENRYGGKYEAYEKIMR